LRKPAINKVFLLLFVHKKKALLSAFFPLPPEMRYVRVMTQRPLIGLTLDAERAGGWSKYPWYALRQNYFEAVVAAGGLPVGLPHDPGVAAEYLERLDGLIVTGGAFDVDPAMYGGGERHGKVVVKENRTLAELAFLQTAMARDVPVLGICGGEQLLAVALGGTLIQHIPDAVEGALAHEQKTSHYEAGHEVAVVAGTRLFGIVGGSMRVNSSHHQAVKTAGRSVVNARAADGVIEGVEDPERRFCLGVQWHPEYFVGPGDRAIFDAFVAACRE
jgi:putative glutamine amidotransferase